MPLEYALSQRGGSKLIHDGFSFVKDALNSDRTVQFWRCDQKDALKCKTRVHTANDKTIKRLLGHEKTSDLDATRLVMLYALHYETHSSNDLNGLVNILRRRGVPDKFCKAVRNLVDFGGSRRRDNDLFGNKSTMAITKKFFKGIKGVENIYTQHRPYIVDVLDMLTKGKLNQAVYPPIDTDINPNLRVQDVILFMVGGITYEEVCAIHNFNKANPGTRVILGGTCLHNCRSFLEEVIHATQDTTTKLNA